MRSWRTFLLDSLILVCLSIVLIGPLFRLKYLDNWPSIESTFIAEARMIAEHLPHPGWQPLWYCGTRTDYIYPPGLLYGTVLIMKTGHVLPARAYHLFIAAFYVLGIAAVYWLVRTGSGSRTAAWISAAGTALLSPSFVVLTSFRHDSAFWVPQRLHALMAYGEGPHISSLCLIPAALAAAFVALRKRRIAALAAASLFCALVVSINFYGATALAIFYPILVWSVWNSERDWGILWRAAAIPLLAYGLCAFWLTPSYVRITLVDLKWVAQPGTGASRVGAAIVVALYCILSWRFAGRRSDLQWRVFVLGAALFFSLDVLGFIFFGFRVAGDSVRLIPELDLVWIFVFAEIFRELWRRPKLRMAAVALVVIMLLPSIRYLRHAWSPFPKAAPIDTVTEYKVTQWVHDHLPRERVLPVGAIRFWFDVWADNEQPDGGSLQGMLNQVLPTASWQILHATTAEMATLWLRALGTDAAVVLDKTAPGPYHDYEKPEQYLGVLPVLYDNDQGTRIYRVPRVYPGIARVVDNDQIHSIQPIIRGDNMDGLRKYVSAVEDPARPQATVAWNGPDETSIGATVRRGESILLQETWDPAWHAYENGMALPIRAEPLMDFMLIDAPEGSHQIQLRFETPLENRVGQVLFFVTAAVMIGLVVIGVRRVPAQDA